MKLLILGGDGMLGHQLLTLLQADHDVQVTLRQPLSHYRQWPLFSARNAIAPADARDWPRLAEVIRAARPETGVRAAAVGAEGDGGSLRDSTVLMQRPSIVRC